MDKVMCARLRAARKEAGLTQVQLADKLGITGAAYASYEGGRREPSLDMLIRVANALGIPVAALAAPAQATEVDQLCEDIRNRADLQPVVRRLLSASPSAVAAVDRLLAMLG